MRGYKVGPLFADTLADAELCIRVGGGITEEGIVYIDVPEVNSTAVDFALAHGMREVFRTMRMYRDRRPTMDLTKVFGVTSLELG